MRTHLLLIISIIAIAGMFGCSATREPINPNGDKPNTSFAEPIILGAVDFSYDENSNVLNVIPNRDIAAHFNVTRYIVPNHIHLTILGWDPTSRVLTVQVTIDNPTNLDVYDVRGILTNMGAKKLLNADDYTKLFDKNTPPIANPFRAFAKDEPNRKLWGRYANPNQYTKSETYEIYFPSEISATFIITASWPSNAPEPFDIVDIQQSGTLYETSGSIDVVVEVLDWQDISADHVIIESNPVTGADIFMTQFDMSLWSATITNDGGALEGDYEAWVAAYDASVPYALYNKFTIHVNPDTSGIFYDDFTNFPHIWTAHGGNWWGKYNGYMDATHGGQCYEEDTGSDEENLNVSYVSSPAISVPSSSQNLELRFHHTIDVDPVGMARMAWDMCYVRINGVQVFPTGGPPYEENRYPFQIDYFYCWTDDYAMTESIFNLGKSYNGKSIRIEFVLDTYDYIDNCKPLHFGWLIDDVSLDFI